MKYKINALLHFLILQAFAIFCILSVKDSYAQFQRITFSNEGFKNFSLNIDNDFDNTIFETNSVLYDMKTGIITTVGGVHSVSPDGRTAFDSDNLIYNTKEQLLMINGDVVLKRDDNILKTENVVMSSDFKQIQAGHTKVELVDGSVAEADSLERRIDNVHSLKGASYTACPVRLVFEGENEYKDCSESDDVKQLSLNDDVALKKEHPTWEIKASTISQDLDDKTMSYTNAFVYLWGVPVFYIPYILHPDPSITHRTGFLFPTISTSVYTGTSLSIPFYIYLNDYSYLKLTPMLNTKNGSVLIGEYKQNFKNLRVSFDGSVNDIFNTEKDMDRSWYVNYQSYFIFNEIFRGALNIRRVSDDTYLRRYDLSNEPWLTSNLLLEGFWERSRLEVSGILYQDLRSDTTSFDIVDVYPSINYVGRTDGDSFGGFWEMNFNTVSLHKNNMWQDRNYRNTRLSASILRQNNHFLNNGVVLETALYARGDYYNVDNSLVFLDPNYPNNGSFLKDDIFRGYAEASVLAKYPMYRNGFLGTEVLEPIVQVVLSPDIERNLKIENRDSIDIELDDKNLFSLNRNSGYDMVDVGNRINYGFNWYTVRADDNISFMLGQSLSYSDNNDYPDYSGLNYKNGISDIVGRFSYIRNKYLDLHYRFRISNDLSQFNKNEFSISTWIYNVRLFTDYVFLRDVDDGSGKIYDREEIFSGIRVNLNRYWATYANARYNIYDKRAVSYGLGARYQNDCFAFAIEMEKKYSYDRDYKGDTIFLFTFAFKNLGTFSTKSGGSLTNRQQIGLEY